MERNSSIFRIWLLLVPCLIGLLSAFVVVVDSFVLPTGGSKLNMPIIQPSIRENEVIVMNEAGRGNNKKKKRRRRKAPVVETQDVTNEVAVGDTTNYSQEQGGAMPKTKSNQAIDEEETIDLEAISDVSNFKFNAEEGEC
jgi:hypothetical protein